MNAAPPQHLKVLWLQQPWLQSIVEHNFLLPVGILGILCWAELNLLLVLHE